MTLLQWVFILDAEGLICDLNFTGAELLGNKRFSLMGSNFRLFVSEGSLLVFIHFIESVFHGHTKAFCELILGNEKKIFHHVYMEGIVVEDEKECLLSVIDISAFKK